MLELHDSIGQNQGASNQVFQYDVILGYVNKKTATPYLLVSELPHNPLAVNQVKMLNTKDKTFLDNGMHAQASEIAARATNTKAGDTFKYQNRAYIKLSDDSIKILCRSPYVRSDVLFG